VRDRADDGHFSFTARDNNMKNTRDALLPVLVLISFAFIWTAPATAETAPATAQKPKPARATAQKPKPARATTNAVADQFPQEIVDLVQRMDRFGNSGDYDTALKLADEILTLMDRHSIQGHRKAGMLVTRASYLARIGKFEAAANQLDTALTLVPVTREASPFVLIARGTALTTQVAVLRELKHSTAELRAKAKESVELFESARLDEPRWLPFWARAYQVLALIEDDNKDYTAALTAIERAISLHEKLPEPRSAEYALSTKFSADCLASLGRHEDSARRFALAGKRYERLDPLGVDQAECTMREGDEWRDAGDHVRATVVFRDAAKRFKAAGKSPDSARALNKAARLLDRSAQFEKSLELRTEALSLLTGADDDVPLRAEIWAEHGRALRQLGRLQLAADAYGTAADLYGKAGNASEHIRLLGRRGRVLIDHSDFAAARDALQSAAAAIERAGLPQNDVRRAGNSHDLGTALRSLGRPQEALEQHRAAHDIFASIDTDDAREGVADALRQMGLDLQRLQRTEEAAAAFEKAAQRYSKTAGGQQFCAMSLQAVAEIKDAEGLSNEALSFYDRAIAVSQGVKGAEVQAGLSHISAGELRRFKLKQDDQFVKHYVAALGFFETAQRNDLCATTSESIAEHYLSKSRYDDSLRQYENAISFAARAKLRSLEARITVGKSVALLKLGRTAESDKVLEAGERGLLDAIGSNPDAAWDMLIAGNALSRVDLYGPSIQLLQRATMAYRTQPSKRDRLAFALKCTGDVQYMMGDYAASVRSAEESLAEYRSTGTTFNQAAALLNLATNCHANGDSQRSLAFAEQALKVFQTLPRRERDQARCLTQIARIRASDGDLRVALESYEKAARLYAQDPGDAIERAITIRNEADVLRELGEYERALKAADEALALCKSVNAPVKQSTLALWIRALVLSDQGKYGDAIETMRVAIEMCGATERERKNYLRVDVGRAYAKSDQPDKSFTEYDVVIAELQGTSDPALRGALGSALENRASLLRHLKRPAEARQAFEAARQAYRNSARGPNEEANCIRGTALTYADTNELQRAIALLDEAVALVRKRPGAVVTLATCLEEKANVLSRLRQHDEAIATYTDAIQLLDTVKGQAPEQGRIRLKRAATLYNNNRPVEAEVELEQTVGALEHSQNGKLQQAAALVQLANTLDTLGRYAEARRHLQRALELYRSQPSTTEQQAEVLWKLAAAGGEEEWRSEDRKRAVAVELAESLEYLNQARKLFSSLPDSRRALARCDYGEGMVLYARGKNEEAIAKLRIALEKYQQLPETQSSQAYCLLNIAMPLMRMRRHAEAAQAMEQAVLLLNRLPDSYEDVKIMEFMQAQAAAALGDRERAAQSVMAVTVEVWNRFVFSLPLLSREQKATFVRRMSENPEADVRGILYTLAFGGDGKAAVKPDGAFDLALMLKDVTGEVMRQQRVVTFDLASASPAIRAKVDELQQLKLRAATLATAALRPELGLSNKQADAIRRQRLREYNGRISELEKELARANIGVRDRLKLSRVTSSQVASVLGPTDVLLEYVRYTPIDFETRGRLPARYGVFVARHDGSIDAIDLGETANIDAAIAAFIDLLDEQIAKVALANVGPDLMLRYEQKLAVRGDAVKQLLLGKVLPLLAERSRVYVAPDSQVSLIPFGALPVEPAQRGLQYLAEKHQFVYLTSGRDLWRFSQRGGGGGAARADAVLIGGPNFKQPAMERAKVAAGRVKAEGPQAVGEAQPAASAGALASMVAEPGSGPVTLGGLLPEPAPLPGAAVYLEGLRRDVFQRKGIDAVCLTGPQATAESLLNVGSPRFLQLLTHGFFVPLDDELRAKLGEEDNPLYRSVLAMGGAVLQDEPTSFYRVNGQLLSEADARGQGLDLTRLEASGDRLEIGDGWVTAYEITELDLRNTEVVTLAACQTARGETLPGEGVAGLRQAFLLAGARSIVMSMWEIPTDESLALMKSFYEAEWVGADGTASGVGRFEAFRAAQAKLLAQTRKDRGCSHPFYWSGLVYIGDPGDLAARRE
jgi:tetratricopeptide (TPR) repeat protein